MSGYRAAGKQVLSPTNTHYADARDEDAARHIAACLNRPVNFTDRPTLAPRYGRMGLR